MGVIILETGDDLRAKSSAATALVVSVFGVEDDSGLTAKKLVDPTTLTGGGTYDTIISTVGAGKQVIIKHIRVVNYSGSDATIDFYLGGQADGDRIWPATTVLAGGHSEWGSGWKSFNSDGEVQSEAVTQEKPPTDSSKNNPAITYTWTGANLTKASQVIGGVTYEKTYSYDGDNNLTGETAWTEV